MCLLRRMRRAAAVGAAAHSTRDCSGPHVAGRAQASRSAYSGCLRIQAAAYEHAGRTFRPCGAGMLERGTDQLRRRCRARRSRAARTVWVDDQACRPRARTRRSALTPSTTSDEAPRRRHGGSWRDGGRLRLPVSGTGLGLVSRRRSSAMSRLPWLCRSWVPMLPWIACMRLSPACSSSALARASSDWKPGCGTWLCSRVERLPRRRLAVVRLLGFEQRAGVGQCLLRGDAARLARLALRASPPLLARPAFFATAFFATAFFAATFLAAASWPRPSRCGLLAAAFFGAGRLAALATPCLPRPSSRAFFAAAFFATGCASSRPCAHAPSSPPSCGTRLASRPSWPRLRCGLLRSLLRHCLLARGLAGRSPCVSPVEASASTAKRAATRYHDRHSGRVSARTAQPNDGCMQPLQEAARARAAPSAA